MVEVATSEFVQTCAGIAADRGAARERFHRENAAWTISQISPRAGCFLIASDSRLSHIDVHSSGGRSASDRA